MHTQWLEMNYQIRFFSFGQIKALVLNFGLKHTIHRQFPSLILSLFYPLLSMSISLSRFFSLSLSLSLSFSIFSQYRCPIFISPICLILSLKSLCVSLSQSVYVYILSAKCIVLSEESLLCYPYHGPVLLNILSHPHTHIYIIVYST